MLKIGPKRFGEPLDFHDLSWAMQSTQSVNTSPLRTSSYLNTVDGCEILHQLKNGGLSHPMIYAFNFNHPPHW